MSAELLAIAHAYKQAALEQGCNIHTGAHRCTHTCRFSDVPILRYRTGHICSPYVKECQNPIHAFGPHVRCDEIPRHEVAVCACAVSGNSHFCGKDWCTETVDTDDGNRVCRWTGVVMLTHVATYKANFDVTKMEGYVPRNSEAISLENEADRAAQSLFSTLSVSRKGSGRESFRVMCLKAAASILSPLRFKNDITAVHRDTAAIQLRIDRYLAKCNAEQTFPDNIVMMSICVAERTRVGDTVILRASEFDVSTLAAHYANVTQILWGILRTTCRVGGGEQVTKRQNFQDFTLAVFEFMQTGLIITSPYGDRVSVIDVDPLLSVMPMTRTAQATVLKQAKNLANMRKNIERALQTCVNTHHVNPQELRISSLSIEAFDQSVFF